MDSTSAYWATVGQPPTDIGTSGGTPTTLVTGQTAPTYVAVDSTSVYWTTGTAVVKLTPK